MHISISLKDFNLIVGEMMRDSFSINSYNTRSGEKEKVEVNMIPFTDYDE